MRAPCTVDGSMNAAKFLAYVKQCLAPTLKRKDIVVIDNLADEGLEPARIVTLSDTSLILSLRDVCSPPSAIRAHVCYIYIRGEFVRERVIGQLLATFFSSLPFGRQNIDERTSSPDGCEFAWGGIREGHLNHLAM